MLPLVLVVDPKSLRCKLPRIGTVSSVSGRVGADGEAPILREGPCGVREFITHGHSGESSVLPWILTGIHHVLLDRASCITDVASLRQDRHEHGGYRFTEDRRGCGVRTERIV